jgi:serine/threonine protein kinase
MGAHDEPIADLARARVGTLVGDKWRLERVLGVGGMASVYAAVDDSGNHVAIKMLHPTRSALPGLKERFLREGFAANDVGHSGVVRAFEGGVADDGSVFLVMELVDGETLEAHWIRRGRRLAAGEVLYIADRVLDILESAHGIGVLHRDVKPENVMLTREGVVKLLDFGIARLQRGPLSRRGRPDLTMGTPAFMAPEQLHRATDEIDGRTDLWALGATMFLLLSGRHVHSAPSVQEQVAAAATRDAPSLREALPYAPTELIELVDRALAFQKEDRWQTPLAMREALRATAASMGELVDRWDIELPPACISSRPIPISIRPPDPFAFVDPRTPTLPTLDFATLGDGTLRSFREQRRMVALGFLLTGASLFAFGFRAQRLLSSASSVQAQQTIVRVEALSPSPTILPAPSASAADANTPRTPPAPEHDPRSSQR